jgi:regulatory protein YycH of two-component signal transduction system YycFG
MSYENIKSFLLTLLVLMSLVLTWSLWTYQPNYGVIENTKYIKDVNIGIKRDSTSLILPQKVLFHKSGHHYGTSDGFKMEEMINNMREWNFESLRDITSSIGEGYLDFIHGRDGVEVIFPSEIPIETLKGIINIEDDGIRSLTFDRIVIPVNQEQQEEAVAYFVSYKHQYVYEARLSNFPYRTFYRESYQVALRYPQYFDYKIDANHSIFLPSDPIKKSRITYYSIKFPGEDFKNALFTDQSFIKKDIQESGDETYSDGARALFIDSNGDRLRYINPIAETDQLAKSAHDTIQKSIDFVNDHSGWTDSYQFSEFDPTNQSTTFRLHIKGLPVFNYSGLSRMVLTWDGTGLFNIYQRPLFKLHLSIDSESSEVVLPSGKTLIELLKQTPTHDLAKLEDAMVGYEMKKDLSSAKVTVEPIWCILYKGTWQKVVFEDTMGELGGNIIVLE